MFWITVIVLIWVTVLFLQILREKLRVRVACIVLETFSMQRLEYWKKIPVTNYIQSWTNVFSHTQIILFFPRVYVCVNQMATNVEQNKTYNVYFKIFNQIKLRRWVCFTICIWNFVSTRGYLKHLSWIVYPGNVFFILKKIKNNTIDHFCQSYIRIATICP